MHPEKHPSTRAIMDSIRRIVQSLRFSSKEIEKQLGLTSAQLFVLQKLNHAEGLSINQLADLTFTHQSSVSAVVTKLADQGLVKRCASPEDGRKIEVTLTAKGRSVLNRAPEAAQERILDTISKMPEADQLKLAELLTSITSSMSGNEAPPPLFFEDEERTRRPERERKAPQLKHSKQPKKHA